MLSPHEYHLFNRNALGFREEEVDENGHDKNPASKEEEDPKLERAEEGEERLSYSESEKKIYSYCNALSG